MWPVDRLPTEWMLNQSAQFGPMGLESRFRNDEQEHCRTFVEWQSGKISVGLIFGQARPELHFNQYALVALPLVDRQIGPCKSLVADLGYSVSQFADVQALQLQQIPQCPSGCIGPGENEAERFNRHVFGAIGQTGDYVGEHCRRIEVVHEFPRTVPVRGRHGSRGAPVARIQLSLA